MIVSNLSPIELQKLFVLPKFTSVYFFTENLFQNGEIQNFEGNDNYEESESSYKEPRVPSVSLFYFSLKSRRVLSLFFLTQII